LINEVDDMILDHVLIAVRDLDETRDFYSALGFQVTPEGLHPGRGTSNRLVVFGPDYLELISVREPGVKLFRPNLAPFLKKREGLFLFAIGTTGLQAHVKDLQAKGVSISNPIAGRRQADDGSTAYSWTQAEIDPKDTPGCQTFLIQHNHPFDERYTEPRDPADHPNGVIGIHSLTLGTVNAQESADVWKDLFGLQQTYDCPNGMVRLKFANCYLEFIDDKYDEGVVTPYHGKDHNSGPLYITYRVRSLDDCHSFFSLRGVPSKTEIGSEGTSISIPPEYASGVKMRLVEV
tara:strand:+ start:1345 stop:2217 length:873 start_codon:yes stop_codon:yes gene_type:complete